MSDMLSIGASGLRAYQTALTTTSENIANAGNAAYVRRSTNIREVSATPGLIHGQTTGLGVTVQGLVRAGDVYRAGEVRAATADLAKTETGITWLQRIEDALTGNKLDDRLSAFFTSARRVSADPASLPPRAAMLEAAASAANAFASTGASLDAAAADLDATAKAAVAELNGLSTALAKVNAGLSRAGPGTSGAASMLDQRDHILEQMSAITDIAVEFDHIGRVMVHAGNGLGPLIVQGDRVSVVSYARNDSGAVAFAVHGATTSSMAPNGGVLAGVAEGANRIIAARDEVEAIAKSFAEGVNALQAGGHDLDGASGEAMFAIGDPAYKLAVALAGPRGIAAAAENGGIRDNSNLTALEALRGSGKFEEQVSSLTAANAGALAGRQTVASAQGAMRDSAISARSAATGVNIDEEAVDLLRFQQAYQASSRVIQIARETLQSIFDIR